MYLALIPPVSWPYRCTTPLLIFSKTGFSSNNRTGSGIGFCYTYSAVVVTFYRKKMREMSSNIKPPKTTKPRITARNNSVRSLGMQRMHVEKLGALTEPEGRDGRLELLLGPLLDVGLRLATTSVLLLDELGVPLSLL